MKTVDLKVEITDIKVEEKYYSFVYIVTVKNDNGIKIVKHRYSDSHSRNNDKEKFKKDLENGYAVTKSLEDVDLQDILNNLL